MVNDNLTWIILPVAACLFSGCDQGGQPVSVLRLAVTTSTRDSGLLDVLVPVFERQHGVRVDVIAAGTGKALKLGEAGDVDVVLVHARAAEEAFMAAGHGVRREEVMYNTFEILGPADDPAGIRDTEPAAALRKIADGGHRFISRGDDSGTHKRERALWQVHGDRPNWDAYVESGQGMGATLTMADQMSGYVLTDQGTYLRFRDKINLVELVTELPALRNVYGVLLVNPAKHERINARSAEAFVDFLLGAEAQRIVASFTIGGERLFHPLALPVSQQAPS
jgi:tungstate transport system substrate-binding protein